MAGRAVPTGYSTTDSGSTIVHLKADYLKSLTAGKHIIGVVYEDGKALAIFSVTQTERRGVATGDGSNALIWAGLMAASLIALGALSFAFVRGERKKKKRKTKK